MSNAVYIAGYGMITSIGNNVAENKDSLLAQKENISLLKRLPTNKQLPGAEVALSNEELAHIAKLSPTITRTALLSMIAAREAFYSFDLEDKMNYRSGFISANTVGGMDKTEVFIADFLADENGGKLHQVVNHDCGASTEIVAKELGIHHYVSTISTACSSAANALAHAARLIRHDILDWAIAGGTDSFSRFTLNGFNSLMILDKEKCRPFDESRVGLNLGEGAGYLVLVSDTLAEKLSLKPTVKLAGYFNANDAFHQTASSAEGDGNYLAMSGALDSANLTPNDIDYINLHGTGTQNNDSSEGIAIKRLFDGELPPISSTKTYTGHTLAACGAIEGIYACMAINNGVLFPNLRFQKSIKEHGINPITKITYQSVNNVLSNSFGFGGNCSSLIFSKVATL
jgi:3-oxoacyl-[acyl-carrier-protein] synthase-1